jgi:hypothetical protein
MRNEQLTVWGLGMRKRRTAEERYNYNVRKQRKILEEFAEREIVWAEDLLYWYGANLTDIPDDEYRACVFFINKEFLLKPGSLSLMYQTYLRCMNELPLPTKENAFDLLGFRYKMYARVLKQGGYDGRYDGCADRR